MFNPILHQPIRTQIISLLIKYEVISFKMIKENLNLSDGNLATHLKKLLEAKYIDEEKFFDGKRPKTNYKINTLGIKSFREYIKELKELIDESS